MLRFTPSGSCADVDARARARVPPDGAQQAAHHADGRGLAGAVGAQEAEDLALLDVERDAVDGREVAEALGEAVELDRGRHGVSVPSRAASAASDRRSGACADVRSRPARSSATSASSSSDDGMTPSR